MILYTVWSQEYGFENILTPDLNQALDRIRAVRNLRAYRGIKMHLLSLNDILMTEHAEVLDYELER